MAKFRSGRLASRPPHGCANSVRAEAWEIGLSLLAPGRQRS